MATAPLGRSSIIGWIATGSKDNRDRVADHVARVHERAATRHVRSVGNSSHKHGQPSDVDEALLAHESEHAQHDVVQRRIALAEARKETPGIGTARLELPNEVTVNLGTHRLGGGHQKLKRARAPPASPRPGGHRARAETIRALARRVVDGSIALGPGIEGRAAIAALKTVRGIGDWTAEYIAMRAYGDRDAFPSGDLVLRRAAGNISARDLNRRSDAWRPWRAYAVMLLWQHTNDECHTGARGAVEGRCIAD